MKTILMLLFILSGFSAVCQSADTTKAKVHELPAPVSDAQSALKENRESQKQDKRSKSELSNSQWVLVYLPIGFFLIIFFYFMHWLKLEKYQLSSALSGDIPVSVAKVSTTTTTTTGVVGIADSSVVNTQQSAEEIMPKSASRFIAFITAVAAIAIGLVILSVEIYTILAQSNNSVDFDGLWKIMASMGIGIIPYGANQIKQAIQNPKV